MNLITKIKKQSLETKLKNKVKNKKHEQNENFQLRMEETILVLQNTTIVMIHVKNHPNL